MWNEVSHFTMHSLNHMGFIIELKRLYFRFASALIKCMYTNLCPHLETQVNTIWSSVIKNIDMFPFLFGKSKIMIT